MATTRDSHKADLEGYPEVIKVLEWLPNAPDYFDATFVHSIHARLESGRKLTDKQLENIRRIISTFKIGAPKRQTPGMHNRGEYYKLKDPLSHFY